jgi:hypothetical protein
MHWVSWQIPKSISLGLIIVIFAISYFYAVKHPARPAAPEGEPGHGPSDHRPE